MRIDLEITLLEDTAISSDATQRSGHECMSYIPGNKILGCVSAQYEAFGPLAWDVFHSGATRFGNAYPARNGQRCLPVARMWTEKPDANTDPALDKSARDKFFFGDEIVGVQAIRRQKTSNSRQRRGAVEDGQFFDVAALAQGQVFAASVWIEDGFPEIRDRLSELLDDCEMTFGRSRNTEFGLAKCRIVERAPLQTATLGQSISKLRVFCASDVDFGNMTGREICEYLGLSDKWSFGQETKTRRNNSFGFNSHRKLNTTERAVIEKGSVLIFSGPALTSTEVETFKLRCAEGLGAGRSDGFGEVLAEPAFLDAPPLGEEVDGDRIVQASGHVPDDAAYRWALARANQAESETDDRVFLNDYFDQFDWLYRQAIEDATTSYKALKDVAPGKAQWGEVRKIAVKSASAQEAINALFHEEKKAEGLTFGSQSRRVWEFEWEVNDSQPPSFRALLRAYVDDSSDEGDRVVLNRLLLLATEMPRLIANAERERR
ncbi:hypothetical protein [Puniceibacterium sediminis]|uniref:CRISPR-associated protein Csx10 n=1 Tax=Puniceibacterium sediminis TaxID=1608407 RepID=A0A238WDA6_9RHOB|nr:hypothetical protein [Puniceibacterium sediminis]SNR44565.1 hypothetical protein SAMN06265370_105127 [Puniceibacterium sediminis]